MRRPPTEINERLSLSRRLIAVVLTASHRMVVSAAVSAWQQSCNSSMAGAEVLHATAQAFSAAVAAAAAIATRGCVCRDPRMQRA